MRLSSSATWRKLVGLVVALLLIFPFAGVAAAPASDATDIGVVCLIDGEQPCPASGHDPCGAAGGSHARCVADAACTAFVPPGMQLVFAHPNDESRLRPNPDDRPGRSPVPVTPPPRVVV